ncbi:DUF4298 domain-containing protein [Psychrobacter sp. K31L]|uniref:DUF4298 domain-containing protein n=1 Tax=Psychrobacter sp. K31L TaxID=2820758 RepID=UPI001B329729|nr:DUF4298 domain-containing protein [Psychrobacter sp. K31L]MBP3945212.1 DUF4298 domain-containing protein [Psychrobacter sp. K31L]
MDIFDAQALQKKYERWHELYEQIQGAQEKWLEANTLLSELQTYYQSEQWRKDHESNVMVECADNMYSIISEDALWSALTDHQEHTIRWMRLGLDVIDS